MTVLLRKPQDTTGQYQALMAQELSDLNPERIVEALKTWLRGDVRFMQGAGTEYDISRVGSDMPLPKDIRQIVRWLTRDEWRYANSRRAIDELNAMKADKEAHPENYPSLSEALLAVLEAKQ